MREVPDELLSTKQQRVKSVTLSGKPHFDRKAAAQQLAALPMPLLFLDFETIQFTVPIWKGTRPYEQIPFQFSLHRLSNGASGLRMAHEEFLDLSGNDPSQAFAHALIEVCGTRGSIVAYNAGFERGRIQALADRFPRFARHLLTIADRLVDLLPVARDHYYHPSQQGSWSIKAILPALCPDLDYSSLDGVQDGGLAMAAYQEAIAPETPLARRLEIDRELRAYCALDTYAMVRLWAQFTGTLLVDRHGQTL